MTVLVAIKLSAIERILILTQSWQSFYLGGKFVRGIEPSGIADLIQISATPLSGRERSIYFSTLSRLIDEYLIAAQFREAWPVAATALGSFEDVLSVLATHFLKKRREWCESDGTRFELEATSRGNAARSAAHLTFLRVLSQNIGLLDCDLESCGCRFILGTKGRTRFCSGKCRRTHHHTLARVRKRRFRNSRRIDIAIRVISEVMARRTWDWRIAVLTAWAEDEGRKVPINLKTNRRRRSNHVPRADGCRLLASYIDIASHEDDLILLQKLVGQCCDGSRIAMLSQLIRRAERIRTNPNEAMMDLLENRRKRSGYS